MSPEEALAQAMERADGFPPPGALVFSARVIEQLDQLGFEVVERDTVSIRTHGGAGFTVTIHPCRCPAPCIAHPFGPPRN